MGCNFTEPFDHSPPVHHFGGQRPLSEWPDDCIWAQLQYERWRHDSDKGYTSELYLENLEREWARRGICSRCHREIDPDLNAQVSDLEARTQDAEDKLGRIRRLIMVTPDTMIRPEIMKILDQQ
jgi:hypothetical protein